MPINKTICELFAGVGGFRLGFNDFYDNKEVKIWNVVYSNQFEPNKKNQYAYKCYTSHFLDGIHTNIDISLVNSKDIPTHSLLTAGLPCQDYSVANTNAQGIYGKKGVLWWEVNRILSDKNSPFVLLENVDRLLKSPAKQRGRDFGIMLSCFNKLNFSVEWRVINAAEYGFVQRRRRIFIFAFRNDTNFAKKISSENLKKWLHEDGFFCRKFPIQSININLYSESNNHKTCILDDDIITISNTFSYPFENSGIMTHGKIYTEKIIPLYKNEIPLSTILEHNVQKKYYINEEDLNRWQYLKGVVWFYKMFSSLHL